jgi:phosphoribosylanthranilate isomerase
VIRVKICGLTRREDAELATELGADALGFIFEPSSPRFIAVPETLTWLNELGPYVTRVAVFGPLPEAFSCAGFQAVQAIGASALTDMAKQRIEVIRLTDHALPGIETACDAILLDAHQPGIYGGTGRRIDWPLAAEVVRASPTPVILAGGLTPDNVRDAIEQVRPYAVDVSSGVESSPGIKDHIKLRDFIEAVKGR